MSEGGNDRLIEETLGFYGQTLDWLETPTPTSPSRSSSISMPTSGLPRSGSSAVNHSGTPAPLVDMLGRGYTGQTWPTMRAIHEVNRLLGAVADADEEEIVARWLADEEVAQREARAAEAREAERVAKQMEQAGLEPISADVAELTKVLYRAMSKAAHHQRSIVDESVDAEARQMVYGPDPRAERRLDFTIFAGALMHEVLLKVGDSLSRLWGPPFYRDHLVPMLRGFEEMLGSLDVIERARRLGFEPYPSASEAAWPRSRDGPPAPG